MADMFEGPEGPDDTMAPSGTATQLQAGPTENKHGLPGPGQEFHGNSDLSIDPGPDHMVKLPSPVSQWFLGKLFD
jgi:hypothetical protein